jgi:hypothetical protein
MEISFAKAVFKQNFINIYRYFRELPINKYQEGSDKNE